MSRILFRVGQDDCTEEQFEQIVSTYLFPPHSSVLVKTSNPLHFNAVLVAAIRNQFHLYLVPSHFSDEEVQEILENHPVQFSIPNEVIMVHETGLHQNKPDNGSITLFSSGTTGSAKMILFDPDSLQHSALKAFSLKNKLWVMTYGLATYAGLQVFFSAYHNEGIIFYPDVTQSLAPQISELDVQVISATPSYWRSLINSWNPALKIPPLDQATLGGESVHQDILDQIKKVFNPKKITHIYASSEGGTSIVVSDGLEGFPASFLDQDKEVKLRVREGQLEIKTPFGMKGYVNKKTPITADGWIETGDLVEIKNSRVYFLGREDQAINVGGMKVHPEEVEKALEKLDEIHAACVYAKKNPMTGYMVAANIVMREGYSLDIPQLTKKLQSTLANYKIPRLIKQVDQIEVSPNGKKIRPR